MLVIVLFLFSNSLFETFFYMYSIVNKLNLFAFSYIRVGPQQDLFIINWFTFPKTAVLLPVLFEQFFFFLLTHAIFGTFSSSFLTLPEVVDFSTVLFEKEGFLVCCKMEA